VPKDRWIWFQHSWGAEPDKQLLKIVFWFILSGMAHGNRCWMRIAPGGDATADPFPLTEATMPDGNVGSSVTMPV
jgi:hypothetical protein